MDDPAYVTPTITELGRVDEMTATTLLGSAGIVTGNQTIDDALRKIGGGGLPVLP